MERLQKIIAKSGYCSRRKAEELISTNHVSVNGNIVNEMGFKVGGNDAITIDRNELNQNLNKVYFLINKPRGVICSNNDEHGRKTIVELINTKERIYPIGRLDYDTTGIILLTNDGEFANLLMHPRFGLEKTYLAKINGLLDKKAIDNLKHGVVVDGRKVKIIDFKIKKKDIEKNTSMVEIKIIEGRNHIVKNIFKELGYDVIKLVRTGYGFLFLDNLQPGDYRELSIKEVKKFYSQEKTTN